MLGIHRTTATVFGRRAARTPANSRPSHHRRRRGWRVEYLEGRTLLSQFNVTNLNDSGDGSLRHAIELSNSTPGPNEIDFAAGLSGTITLTSGELRIANNDVKIVGPGAKVLSVSGNHASRVFNINYTRSVSISGLTITSGRSPYSDGWSSSGGRIYCGADNLTIFDSNVSNNEATSSLLVSGGGIEYVGSSLTIINSTISDNTASGGQAGGGGIDFGYGTRLTIVNSTISGNRAVAAGLSGAGGGLNFGTGIVGAVATITNSTFNGNIVTNTTPFGGGGGIASASQIVTATNTIVAGNNAPSGPDVAATVNSLGHNLIGNTSGSSGWVKTDLLNVNPKLGPLQDNGGPTMTMALLPGSPAIDAGIFLTIPTTDQRGVSRLQGARPDIGAFELEAPTPRDPEPGSLVVTTLDDVVDPYDDRTSLREALAFATSRPGGDTVSFDAALSGSIDMSSVYGELVLADDSGAVTIDGRGGITLNAQGVGRVVCVQAGTTATLAGLTITGGSASIDGGGIYNEGTLALDACTLRGNSAGDGGGISNGGSLTVTACTLSGNSASAHGGGIYNKGALTIVASTLSGNTAGLDYGRFGGGIANWGALTIVASTLSGNSAWHGGGIANWGTASLLTSIVAGNSAPTSPDSSGAFKSLGHNLIGNTEGSSGWVGTDRPGTASNPIDPRLGPLQDNGGPTWTMALLPGSPAIDTGSNALIPPGLQYDQRGPGFNRIVNGTVDIGAYEFLPAANDMVAVGWGTQSAALQTATDGRRLLPADRNTDLPWLGINQFRLTLSQAQSLSPADVTVNSAIGTKYGPVTVSGSGTSYAITLARPIDSADRVTITVVNPGVSMFNRRLDALPGDVNDDGIVNAQDMVLIRNAIQQPGDPLMIGWADVDGDGSVVLADYLAARKKLGSRLP
jgi:hypothetical protein